MDTAYPISDSHKVREQLSSTVALSEAEFGSEAEELKSGNPPSLIVPIH